MTLFQVGEHIMTQPGPCIPVLFLFYREIHQNYRELRFDFRKGFFLGLGEICCPTCPIAACSHVFPAFPPSKKGPQLLGVDVCGGEYHAECLGTLSTHRHRSEPRTSLFSLTGRMISTGNSPKAQPYFRYFRLMKYCNLPREPFFKYIYIYIGSVRSDGEYRLFNMIGEYIIEIQSNEHNGKWEL